MTKVWLSLSIHEELLVKSDILTMQKVILKDSIMAELSEPNVATANF